MKESTLQSWNPCNFIMLEFEEIKSYIYCVETVNDGIGL